jgi:hypothetical protein
MRKPRRPGAIGLLALLLLLSAGAAEAVVIDFEDVQPGVLQNQYSALGVSFNGQRLMAYPPAPPIAGSGTRAIELCFGIEFCSAPLVIDFSTGQTRVRVHVGLSLPLPEGRTVQLQALDADGAAVTQATVFLPASGMPTRANTALEVVAGSPVIRRVIVAIAAGPSGPSFNNGLVVDDLEFDVSGGPTACTASAPPTVSLSQPLPNTVVSLNRFLLAGTATTEVPLDEATLLVDAIPFVPGSSRTVDLLAPSMIPQQGGTFTTSISELLFPGTNFLRVRVRNCRGSDATTGLITYQPLPADTRFTLLGLEVVQATQDIRNSVPLVANKPTIVRAYLSVQGAPTVNGVTASLTATPPAGSPLPPLLHSSNAIVVGATADLAAQRLNYTASLNFVIPREWTDGRTLHLQVAKLYVEGQEFGAPCDGCNNLDEINAPRWSHFQPTRPLNLVLAPYQYNDLEPDVIFTPMGALQWLNNVYPLAGAFPQDGSGIRILRMLPWRSTSKNLAPNTDDGVDFLDELEEIRDDLLDQYDGIWPSDFYVLAPLPFGRGGRGSQSRGVAYVDTWNLQTGTVVPAGALSSYGSTWAHEVGHVLGRDHAGNAHGESSGGDVDGSFPIPHGGIGEPGLAITTEWWSGATPRVVDPKIPDDSQPHAHDFMSYGHGSDTHTMSWISPYTYRALFNGLLVTQQMSAAPPQPASEKVVVGGRIRPDGTLRLNPFRRLRTRVPAGAGTTGDIRVDLVASDGATLLSHRVQTHTTEGTRDLSFHDFIPWKSGTRRIVVRSEAGVLGERRVSARAPWVRNVRVATGQASEKTLSITWDAGDADGDALTFTVFYQSSAGDPWLPIANRLARPGLTFNASMLPGSRGGRIRVRATDGVNSTEADSAGVFQIPDKPPIVGIVHPSHRWRVGTCAPVELVGTAYDPEDGMVSAEALRWSSSRDGDLGSGRQVKARLSAGTHTITLTARDHAGQSGAAGVTVEAGCR